MNTKLYPHQYVILKNGVLKEIVAISHLQGIKLYADINNDLYFEEEISHAVKYVPDYGEVYCKDCKHFRIAYENEKPIFEGCMCLDELMGNFHMMNWRFDPYFSGDTLRPPPNCNCFEPKEENA